MLILNYTKRTPKNHDPCCFLSGVAQMMAFRFCAIIKSFVCLHQHLYCIWHTLLTVLYAHVGLAAGLARMRV